MVSPKSQQLYQILLRAEQAMDAKQLAKAMNIFPSTVYRLAKPLIDMGLITESEKYPYRFTAKPVEEGLSLFLLSQNDWFTKQFVAKSSETKAQNPNSIPKSKQVALSFIQSRDELMNVSAVEIAKAEKSIDLLRSGHEMPAEVVLAILEAKKRGVDTRMLIQDYSKENEELVHYWQKNGILVRKTPLRHVRLMLFDEKILYCMSYKHTDSGKDMGMEISYPPFAAILSQLFEDWWKRAEIV